jgi:hypothetical protein
VEESVGKRETRCRCKYNIKLDLGDRGYSDWDWVDLAEDRGQRKTVVSTVMNLRVL